MIEYKPQQLYRPPAVLKCPHSAWEGMERILPDILHRFVPGCELAVEFGVEYGYSAVALANYFKHVYAVDPLLQPGNFAQETADRVKEYRNIWLIRNGWRWFADRWEKWMDERTVKAMIDCIHIDIDPHDYPMTFAAGSWAANHSSCVLFHDTHNPIHGEDVQRAISDIAQNTGMIFYCFTQDQGLGILVRK